MVRERRGPRAGVGVVAVGGNVDLGGGGSQRDARQQPRPPGWLFACPSPLVVQASHRHVPAQADARTTNHTQPTAAAKARGRECAAQIAGQEEAHVLSEPLPAPLRRGLNGAFQLPRAAFCRAAGWARNFGPRRP